MRVKIADGVTYGKVGDEAILSNKDRALKLDDQAIMLWEMIMKGYDEDKMISHFVALYPNQKELVTNDIKAFFATLYAEQIIEKRD